MNDLLWQIPVYALAGTMLYRLLVTPYEMWKEQKERADRAEAGTLAGPVAASLWGQINPLQLYQAACLWVEKVPPDGPDVAVPWEAGPWLHRLRDAVAKKRLPIYRDKDGRKYQTILFSTARLIGVPLSPIIPKVPADTEVGRADLAAFAESIGERPAFLFGDAP